MLPVYKAISFDKIIKKGGRTLPWSVLVDTPQGIKPYVVKMFTAELVEKRNSVCNEVLGNVLAREFDLRVPNAALIEMEVDFEMTIKTDEAQEQYDLADERIKFGTELIEGNYLFNMAFTKRQASKMIELDTLFAFDNMIRNRDRNSGKPNLLVKGDSAFLIDHELGFEIDVKTLEDYLNGTWEEAFYRYHIFYNYLKKSRKSQKVGYFEEFHEYLRTLNINMLNNYFQQLHKHGYNISFQPILNSYLYELKQNSSNFVNLLKKII